MIHLQNIKVADFHADTVASGSLATGVVDTMGFDFATIIITAGALAGDLTAIKVDVTDNSDGSTDATNLVTFESTADVGGTTNALNAFDADESILVEVDMIGKGRYLKTTLTAGSGNHDLACVTLLSRAAESPADSAAGSGTTFKFRA